MRKNRRAVLAFLLIAVLVFASVPVQAKSELFFVSVGDTMPLSLPEVQLPYYSDGILFAPHTAFAASGSGIAPSFNAQDSILTLFSRSQRLVFDLNAKTVTDEDGKSHDDLARRVSLRGGVVYLPVISCAAYFGKQVVLLTSEDGYVVLRFKNGNEVYDDSQFLTRAKNLMEYILRQYRAKAQHRDDPAPQAPASQPANPPEEERPSVRACLAVVDTAYMAEALEAVTRAKVDARFYFTAEEIRTCPELVISVAACGYGIGVTAPPDAPSVQEALDDANDALRALLCRKTALALVNEEQYSSVRGYCALSRNAARAADFVAAQKTGTYLLVCSEDTAFAVDVLSAIGTTWLPIRETTTF